MIATRSPIVRIGIQAASPLAIVVGIYLLFAGHNNPGGGFAAGLVFSAVAALRTITGLTQPVRASMLISFGLATVAIVAIIRCSGGTRYSTNKSSPSRSRRSAR